MNRREWLAASSTLLAAACARPRESAISSKDAPAERPDLPSLLQLASVPGLAIATVHGGDLSVEGFGVRRAGTEDKVTGDTVFAAASLSKPVFASIVMQLAAEGTIDLTRPLASYLPLPNPADARAKAITATHVLSHSSGWRNWRNAPGDTLTADFEPGSKFSYSGEGYFFLQRVVEKLTGQGLARLARDRVFTPLGMMASGFIWRPDLDAALASPHAGRGQPMDSFSVKTGKAFAGLVSEMGKPVEEWTTADVEKALPRGDATITVLPDNMVPNAAASLLTTARDYGTFVRWLLGAEPVSGGRAILDRMTIQRSTINEALGWGSGIGLEHAGGRSYVWHWGDNPGFKNFIVGEPATGSAIVIFTNGNAGQRVYERVVRARTGVDHPAFLWL
ncbi:MAG TPA: serine hydrolase domain-containing protein [Gemmatimonadaceae bacterium]|nr:serine hydrolase domain-containing protein [Gemmatimonadaceae bacterium]